MIDVRNLARIFLATCFAEAGQPLNQSLYSAGLQHEGVDVENY
jgi:hypothetical protein